ncbi:uncharacterized protein LOC144927715 [Branchiostoma floridae x Branchiostoma belcheri]
MSTEQVKTLGGFGSDPVFFDSDAAAGRARACCLLFRDEVEKRLNNGKRYAGYVPINYQSQSVAGTNYKILVLVGEEGGAYYHVELEVFWGLGPNTMPELTGVTREYTVGSG